MCTFRLILSSTLLALMSCTAEPINEMNDGHFYNCHLEQKWATADIENHLLGKWRWIYKKCPGSEEGQNYLEFKGQVIIFKDDSTLELINDGEAAQFGTYSISTNGNYYGINTTPHIPSIEGRIFFCFDEMQVNQETTTGCSNYLRKTPF